ncbi:MAG: hypothetical protein AAF889_02245 [Cyanobacteria bacterium P01_D01_bin.73]
MNRNNQNPNNQPPIFGDDSNPNSEPLPFGSFEDQPKSPKDSRSADRAKNNRNLDDRDLVAFLRQHQPTTPPEPANFEANLMAAIAQEPIPASNVNRSIKKAKRLPQIIGAIAAGLVGAGLGHALGVWTNPSGLGHQFADTGSESELELFLEDGWDGAIAQTSSTESTDTSDFGSFYWDTSGI